MGANIRRKEKAIVVTSVHDAIIDFTISDDQRCGRANQEYGKLQLWGFAHSQEMPMISVRKIYVTTWMPTLQN